MSDYSQIVSFGPKDALVTGNPAKLIKGTEIDAELAAIATAIASKANTGTANTFSVDQTIQYTANGTVQLLIDNDSNGTDNAARVSINSGDSSGALFVAGSGRTSVVLTDGPTGAQMVLRTLGSYPLIFGTANTKRFSLSSDGASADFFVTNITNNSIKMGYLGVPQNAQTGNYTLVLADSGKHIYHASGAGAGDTYTIPANASVAYDIGTAVTFINQDSNAVTIAITSDTLTMAGTGSTGSRTLAANGVATAIKVTSTGWIISGTGLS